MPTALERAGDFSKSVNTNGSLIVVKDPLTGNAYSGNMIPKMTFDPTGIGQTILNFFPMPNYFPLPEVRTSINITSRYSTAGNTRSATMWVAPM